MACACSPFTLGSGLAQRGKWVIFVVTTPETAVPEIGRDLAIADIVLLTEGQLPFLLLFSSVSSQHTLVRGVPCALMGFVRRQIVIQCLDAALSEEIGASSLEMLEMLEYGAEAWICSQASAEGRAKPRRITPSEWQLHSETGRVRTGD